MTNDEIRVKIAKLRGAAWWEIDCQAYLCNPMHAAMLPKGAKVVDSPSPGSKVYYRVSNWPVDIKAAEILLDELAENHFSVKLMRWDYSTEWMMIMHHRQGHGETIHDDEIKGDTKCLAICHAFIQWKESQK